MGRLTASWMRLSPNLRAIVWVTLGSIAFALNDVVIKTLGQRMDPLQLAFFRYTVGLIVMAPVFYRIGFAGMKTQRLGLHGIRLAMACVAQIGIFYSVINLPLATATALSFSRILFTSVIAVIALREYVNGRRWAATIIGFGGVLIMVRPGADGVDPIALVAIASAFTFAVANVLIKTLSTTESPSQILFYYYAGAMVVFIIPAWWVWQTPVGVEWVLAVGIGILTSIGMTCFIRGFAIGEASVIGPMEYARLIYAALLGLFIFGEVPDVYTISGAALIVTATISIARMEQRAAKRNKQAGA